MATPPRIFVSHSHFDNAACRQIVQFLRQQLPAALIFFDESELHGGEEWLRRIQHEVVAANVFIVVLSQHSVVAEWVREETYLALSLSIDARKQGQIRTLIPVRIDPDLPQTAIRDFAPLLTLRQVVDLSPNAAPERWNDLAQVVRGEETAPVSLSVPPEQAQEFQRYVTARDAAAQMQEAIKQKQWRTAVRLGQYAVTLPGNEHDATLFGQLAQAQIALDQLDDGLHTLEEALALNGRRTDLWLLRASTLQRQGRLDEALKAWNMAFLTTNVLETRLEILGAKYQALQSDTSPTNAQRTAARREIIADALDLAPADPHWLAEKRHLEMLAIQGRYDSAIAAQRWDDAFAACSSALELIPADLVWIGRRAQLLAVRPGAPAAPAPTPQAPAPPQAAPPPSQSAPALDQWLTPRLVELGYRGLVRDGAAAIIPPANAVPAGEFQMGSLQDVLAAANEFPQRLWLSDFFIGVFPLTVAEWACAMVAGAVREPPAGALRGTTWQEQLAHPDHPVIGIQWHQAVRYALWLAQLTGQPWRLPSEAEWEKAARGLDGRIFPWGNTWDRTRANTRDGGPGQTTPVGAFIVRGDASPYGCHDQAGNVWEWTSSAYLDELYRPDPRHEDINARSSRVLRGGAWDVEPRFVRAAARLNGIPGSVILVGTRLAR